MTRGPQPTAEALAARLTETVQWHPIPGDDLPDDEITVLIASPSDPDPVWLGYHDSELGGWVYINGIFASMAAAWAHLPEGPK